MRVNHHKQADPLSVLPVVHLVPPARTALPTLPSGGGDSSTCGLDRRTGEPSSFSGETSSVKSVQAIWLSYGYRLEFVGEAVFRELWLASVGFFVGNVVILTRVLIARQRSKGRRKTA